jgi:hypothetical protein
MRNASGAPYPVPLASCYCMDARARWRDHTHTPFDLTDDELATAATACRAMASQGVDPRIAEISANIKMTPMPEPRSRVDRVD